LIRRTRILRSLAAGLLLASMTSAVLAQTEAAPVVVEGSPGFDPYAYVGSGDAYNCPNFASQAEAQAVLRADAADPNRLDADKDGIACENNKLPFDLVPVDR
jgi:hypothetical protein